MKTDLSEENPSKQLLLLLTSCFTPAGGMYEYSKAWLGYLQQRSWQTNTATFFEQNETSSSQNKRTQLNIPTLFSHRYRYWELVLGSLVKLPPYSTLIRELSKVIQTEKHKSVHIVDITLFSGTLLLDLAKRHPSTLFVITLHDPRSHEERISNISRILRAENTRKLIAASKLRNVRIHVHSRALLEGSAYKDVDNIIEMPHPLPFCTTTRSRDRLCSSAIPDGLPTSEKKIRIGFLGRIEEYKGLDIFFNAVNDLLQQQASLASEIQVVIAGRGLLINDWSTLPCHVEIFNGFIADQHFHQLMADLDLLILPYKTATQSGVGMMGVAYGIPIIATQTGCLEGTVVNSDYNGIIIPASNVDALSKAIFKLVHDRDYLNKITINAIDYANRLQG